MASQVPAAAGKAIKAAPMFIKYGTGVCSKFSLGREVVVATALGIGLGLMWKTSHWNEKRQIQQFYTELAAKELADEKARKSELAGKLAEIEAALA